MVRIPRRISFARDEWINAVEKIFLRLLIFMSAFLSRLGVSPWGLVLLDARVERVINECGTLCGLIIILRQKGKSAADQLQPMSGGMVVQLAF